MHTIYFFDVFIDLCKLVVASMKVLPKFYI